MLTLATWNVNSLRAREERVFDWLRRQKPEIVCLQETKVTDDKFPRALFEREGYCVAMAGEKTYNGVAIAARSALSEVKVGLLDAGPDDARRLISAMVAGVHVYCVYVPNGKSVDSPAFAGKIDWLKRLRSTLDQQADPASDVVVCGDFNIAPEARDVHDPAAYEGQLHFHPDEHRALAHLKAFGLRDALRLVDSEPARYTWWDYRAGAFRRDRGLRIDHILVSESLSKRCQGVAIQKSERGLEKPSDHVPVVASFR